jgi:acyl-CoA synthetase
MARMNAAALIGEAGYGANIEQTDIFDRIDTLPGLRVAYRLRPPESLDALAIHDLSGRNVLADPVEGRLLNEGERRFTDANAVCYLAFTSGTTGEPKGVMHSSNTLLANARAMAADWSFDRNSVVYSLSPLSHNLGFGAMVLALAVGARLVVHDLGRGKSLLERLIEVGATFAFGVPVHASDLLRELEQTGDPRGLKLVGFRISGAAAPRALVSSLLGYGIRPQSGYGMTEGCSHHYTLPDDSPERVINTSGRACPGYAVRIVSQDDPERVLSAGEVGQIVARGASLMLGYFDDQRSTERSYSASGWFMTGDLGFLDAEGYITITGRKKDIIIRGGHNIFPARIESLAHQYPGLERVAAIPVADDRLGEKVCLVVMAQSRVSIDADDVLAHLYRAGLSKFDMPEYFLQVDEIPLTASGKILKRVVVDAVNAGQLAPIPVRWSGPQS